ncbi:diptericin-D-like [Lucilia cuprina]|uniref:diptericin-D-like n=1 Tax=Lucilia cuprina TaxID=7375 RepID=UPI001F0682B4|nr:diptericin-D-like [Lucilia cuprina]
MNLFYLLLIFGFSMVLTLPQYKIERKEFNFNIPPPNTNYVPQITTSGGGTPDVGKVNIDVRQKIWESQNGRHLIDINGGYSNKWGDPHIKATPDIRYGVGYTFKL